MMPVEEPLLKFTVRGRTPLVGDAVNPATGAGVGVGVGLLTVM